MYISNVVSDIQNINIPLYLKCLLPFYKKMITKCLLKFSSA